MLSGAVCVGRLLLLLLVIQMIDRMAYRTRELILDLIFESAMNCKNEKMGLMAKARLWCQAIKMKLQAMSIFKLQSKGERLAVTLGLIIPRKHRHVIGDILEDCAAMRKVGYAERHIKCYVVWQWLLIVMQLVPSGIINWVIQRLSSPK